MRLAHVRERHAPAGAPWRLAAALDPAATSWLDIEIARRRAVAARPGLAHDSVLHRQPVTTLDDHLGARTPGRGARGSRRGVRAREPRMTTRPRRRRPRVRAADPPAVLASATSTPSSGTSARCGSGAARRSPRRGTGCRSSTSRTSRSCGVRARPSGRHGARRSSTTSSRSARSSTRRRPTCPLERGEEAIGGFFILNDWSARDLQRDETTRPARAGQGQGLRDVDRALAGDARRAGRPSSPGLDRAGPRHDGDRPDRRRASRRDLPRHAGLGPPRLRRDDRARLGRRAPAAGRPHRQRDGRRRLPARDPGADPRPLPRAGRRGHPRGRAARAAS